MHADLLLKKHKEGRDLDFGAGAALELGLGAAAESVGVPN